MYFSFRSLQTASCAEQGSRSEAPSCVSSGTWKGPSFLCNSGLTITKNGTARFTSCPTIGRIYAPASSRPIHFANGAECGRVTYITSTIGISSTLNLVTCFRCAARAMTRSTARTECQSAASPALRMISSGNFMPRTRSASHTATPASASRRHVRLLALTECGPRRRRKLFVTASERVTSRRSTRSLPVNSRHVSAGSSLDRRVEFCLVGEVALPVNSAYCEKSEAIDLWGDSTVGRGLSSALVKHTAPVSSTYSRCLVSGRKPASMVLEMERRGLGIDSRKATFTNSKIPSASSAELSLDVWRPCLFLARLAHIATKGLCHDRAGLKVIGGTSIAPAFLRMTKARLPRPLLQKRATAHLLTRGCVVPACILSPFAVGAEP